MESTSQRVAIVCSLSPIRKRMLIVCTSMSGLESRDRSNKPAAAKPAIASRFQAAGQWRGVAEPGRSCHLRTQRAEWRAPQGRKIVAQRKRRAALGNGPIMISGLRIRLPRAAVAALPCPGLFSPCPSGAADRAF